MKLYDSILYKSVFWVEEEKKKTQSLVGNLITYIEKSNLREPQVEAIKVYLWLKFVGRNQKLSSIIKEGLLYDDEQAKTYENYHTFGTNYITQFLNQFALDNDSRKLHKKLVRDPYGEQVNWEQVLENLLHNYEYPNYLFSLPMGAGKTFLMACFIYIDLYFSRLFKNDKRFAKNFVLFAPQATKTAILPSLQTIKNFDPEWVLPKAEADRVRQIIQIEILDTLSSSRKDKLQGNNPNLEKVNRLTQSKDFGLVFITNAEKVVLERFSEEDKLYLDPNSLMYDEKKASEIVKYNDLREKLSQIPNLMVILDEVHHTYGTNENGEKKLRTAVNILNQHKNVVGVIGMSGTPYVRNEIQIGDDAIKLNQIQDIVYNYSLNKGIGNFLKIPEIRKREIKEGLFIKEALSEFFKDFDITYGNGTQSKIVFYCPSVAVLNEEILPEVVDWYNKSRTNRQDEIFRYYSNVTKENKAYALPKDSLAIFNNLDKPYSDKRVILLVAVGTEGWDCRSLTSVVLPRKETSKNFVLQTTCRCLREVENAEKEKALIFLGDGNYEILESQLKENYHLTVGDLQEKISESIKVLVRKPKLGKLKYKQISTQYKIVHNISRDTNEILRDFSLSEFKKKYSYNPDLTRAKIGEEGLIQEIVAPGKIQESTLFSYSFGDFIYDLARATIGKYSESELVKKFGQELSKIYIQIKHDNNWFAGNPDITISEVSKVLASALMEEVEYKAETIEDSVEIELLEWNIDNPLMSLTTSSGAVYKFMPRIDPRDIRVYQRHPEDLDAEREKIDPQNISFNYIPYKMDSDFERNALEDILKMSELNNLEVYFNGFKDSQLESFWIQTPDGVYTPDFLILKRDGKNISKILILETKGKSFYDDEFKRKEKFMKEVFSKHNPNFKYECFVDEGGNDFSKHTQTLREMLESF